MRYRSTTISLLLPILMTGCGTSGTGPTDPPTGTLTLSATTTLLVPGLTTQLNWLVQDADGTPVADPSVTFSTAPAGIVSVTPDGRVLGLGPGAAVITGRAGRIAGTITISVQEGGVVGAAGGVVRAFGGTVELDVPAGATAAPVIVAISRTSNPLLDPTADPTSTYQISIGTPALNTPATLRLPFDATLGPYGWPAADYRIRRYAGGEWIAAASGASDGAGTASASITVGGIFSVGWAAVDAPCVAAEYREFDFWVGTWSITAGGQPNGLSDITLAPGGCAVLEHYRSLGGDVGRSISFYRPGPGLWYQTYIDNRGGRLEIAGYRQGQTMSLFTMVVGTSLLRTTFTLQPDGTVRHQSALSTDAGSSYLPPTWDGIYTPR